VLTAPLDSGVNLVDTAPDYGESESYLGRYLSEHRDDWLIASKCGCVIETEVTPTVKCAHEQNSTAQ
jgi:aryl-alcohol dehydrogenase-like predicted oxidoreductase